MSLALVQQMLPGASPLLSDLAKQLTNKKQFPLASTITLLSYDPRAGGSPRADNGTDPLSLEKETPPKSTVIQMEVKSIRTDATLEDALFVLPSDYQKVDAPEPQSPFRAP
jgi:hypothetical protein